MERFLASDAAGAAYRPYQLNEYNFGTNNRYEISSLFTLLVLLVTLSLFAMNWVHRKNLRYLPEAGAAVLVGITFSALFRIIRTDTTDALMSFKRDYFFILLLPPILFNGGYSIKRRYLFEHLTAILSFSVVGPLISSGIFGALLWLAGQSGFCLSLSFAECLTFGALISATDPVSVLSVFEKHQVEPTLFYIVFGESLLNDAVSLVLYETSAKFIGYTHSAQSLLLAGLDFLLIFIGSTALGIVMGCICALLLKHTFLRGNKLHECSIYVLFAYIPFLLAEVLEMSGIVAVAFAAITMRNLAHKNLSPESRSIVTHTFKLLAYLAETMVFLWLGLSFFSLQNGWNLPLILVSLMACLVSRAFLVYPISLCLNLCSQTKLDWSQQTMLWFVGLRGAVAFALSLTFPGAQREVIVCTTMSIVLITVFGMGGLTRTVMDLLKIQRLTGATETPVSTKKGFMDTIVDYYMKPTFSVSSTDVSSLRAMTIATSDSEHHHPAPAERSDVSALQKVNGAGQTLHSSYTITPSSSMMGDSDVEEEDFFSPGGWPQPSAQSESSRTSSPLRSGANEVHSGTL